jgi:hypothetical protein
MERFCRFAGYHCEGPLSGPTEAFTMKTLFKFAVAATLTSAIAFAAVTPSQARNGRNAAAIGIGIGAGVLAGAAIANSNNGYYREGYAPGYYAEPGYAYESGYAYEAEPVYVEPAPTYYSRPYRGSRGCGSSPASMNGGQPC